MGCRWHGDSAAAGSDSSRPPQSAPCTPGCADRLPAALTLASSNSFTTSVGSGTSSAWRSSTPHHRQAGTDRDPRRGRQNTCGNAPPGRAAAHLHRHLLGRSARHVQQPHVVHAHQVGRGRFAQLAAGRLDCEEPAAATRVRNRERHGCVWLSDSYQSHHVQQCTSSVGEGVGGERSGRRRTRQDEQSAGTQRLGQSCYLEVSWWGRGRQGHSGEQAGSGRVCEPRCRAGHVQRHMVMQPVTWGAPACGPMQGRGAPPAPPAFRTLQPAPRALSHSPTLPPKAEHPLS